MSNMINHVFQFYVGMLLNWDLFFAHVFWFWFDPIFKVINCPARSICFSMGSIFHPLCKDKQPGSTGRLWDKFPILFKWRGCFCCRVLNDTLQVLFELRCHVWSNLATIFFCKNKENPEVLSMRSSNRWRDRTILGSIFGTDTSISHIQSCFLSNNGRNQSWCNCMVISRYDFVTKVTPDAQVQLREMFQMTKGSILLCDPIQQLILKGSNEQSWFHDCAKGEVDSFNGQYWIYWDAPTQDASRK